MAKWILVGMLLFCGCASQRVRVTGDLDAECIQDNLDMLECLLNKQPSRCFNIRGHGKFHFKGELTWESLPSRSQR